MALEERFNLWAGHYDRGDALWDDESLGTEGNMMVRREAYLAKVAPPRPSGAPASAW